MWTISSKLMERYTIMLISYDSLLTKNKYRIGAIVMETDNLEVMEEVVSKEKTLKWGITEIQNLYQKDCS